MLKHSLVALAAMGMGLAGLTTTGASAFPVQQPAATATSPLMTTVRDRGGPSMGGNHWNNDRRYSGSYNHRYHGDRCSRWSNHCRYRHGDWFYENPWWIVPMVGAGIAIGAAGGYDGGYDGYGSRHVEWCLDRYRSYNPRSNTWVSYSGRVHQCVSPYGP